MSKIKSFPKTAKCFCGDMSYLKYKSVVTKFDSEYIEVTNVPVYECLNLHNRLARITRVNLKDLLREAHKNNKSTVNYY